MRVAVVAGNPKAESRTLAAAQMVAESISGAPADVVIDVVTLGVGLLGFGAPLVAEAVASVQGVDLVVVASPTYKASFTGVLKCFLDQIPSAGLAGVVAVPLMLGAGPAHALAPELMLKPVLVELGATCPTRALYLLDSSYADPTVLEPWLSAARAQLGAYLSR